MLRKQPRTNSAYKKPTDSLMGLPVFLLLKMFCFRMFQPTPVA